MNQKIMNMKVYGKLTCLMEKENKNFKEFLNIKEILIWVKKKAKASIKSMAHLIMQEVLKMIYFRGKVN